MSLSDTTVDQGEGEAIKHRGSPRNNRTQSINLLSNGIPDAMSSSNTIPATISKHTEAVSE
jgi:hypothetical protein